MLKARNKRFKAERDRFLQQQARRKFDGLNDEAHVGESMDGKREVAVEISSEEEPRREKMLPPRRKRFLQQPRRIIIDGFNDEAFVGYGLGMRGLAVKICDEGKPCPRIVTLYAKLGLHRYNLLNRTKLELSRVIKYSYVIPMAASTYYITLSAIDPATTQPLTFQTEVAESSYGKVAFRNCIARPLGETNTNPNHQCVDFFITQNLPVWPSENPFHRFPLLKDPELQSNDWVRLYLELAVATKNRHASELHDPSTVEILKVAIDTTGEDLSAKCATVYIHYKDPCKARVGEDVDRVAIVERNYDDQTGCFSLKGKSKSSAGLMLEDKGN